MWRFQRPDFGNRFSAEINPYAQTLTPTSPSVLPKIQSRLSKRKYYDPIRDSNIESIVDDVDGAVYPSLPAYPAHIEPSHDSNDVGMSAVPERLSPEIAIYAQGPRDWPKDAPKMPSWSRQRNVPTPKQECLLRNTQPLFADSPHLDTTPNSRNVRGYSSIRSPIEVSKVSKPRRDEALIDRLLESKDQSEGFTYSVRRQERLVRRTAREYAASRNIATRVNGEASNKTKHVALIREQRTLRSLAREKGVRENELADTVRKEMDKIVPVLDSWEAEHKLEMAAAELYLNGLIEKQEDLRQTREELKRFRDPRSKSSPVKVLGMLEGVKPLRK